MRSVPVVVGFILTMELQLNGAMVSYTYKLYRVCGNIAGIW